MSQKTISILTPCYNEEENVEHCVRGAIEVARAEPPAVRRRRKRDGLADVHGVEDEHWASGAVARDLLTRRGRVPLADGV